jgi:phosphoserine phosphatase
MKKARIALIYDFDGTLAPGTMQEQSFLPAVGEKGPAFWQEAKARAKADDMDEILAYMELMLDTSAGAGAKSTRAAFKAYGKRIKFFPGVEKWFARMNAYAKQQGCLLSHYIISSGNRETIEGTRIAKHFRKVFASSFRYDPNDVAVWPALAVNYTNKAQFLFRINKGIENAYDNTRINKYTPEEERPYPFKNMVYIGDGETDVPAMKMVTYQGGRSIVVYQTKKKGGKKAAHQLVAEQRADIAVPADYRPGSDLDGAVKASIRQIAGRHAFDMSDTSPLKGRRPPK